MRKLSLIASAVARRALTPFIPPRKMLPFEVFLEWLRGEQDIYQSTFLKFCGSTGVALDIGANLGLYTYHLSKRFKQVHAFEVNAEITCWMEKYNRGNIHIHHCGLSSKRGTATLHIPINNGQLLYGWSTFHEENLPTDADKGIEKECPLVPLDDFAIEGVGFIKIDVEGHELEVLKGAAHTIATSRPIILVEVRTAQEKTVDAWFQALNYGQCRLDRRARLFEVVGAPPSTGDCYFIPRERLREFNVLSPPQSSALAGSGGLSHPAPYAG